MENDHNLTFYQNIHDAIVDRARTRSSPYPKERHHIKPRSLGGDNSPGNLVDLTPREHFLIHLILLRLTKGVDRSKMARAMWRLIKRAPTARLYEVAIRLCSQASKGEMNPAFGHNWFHQPDTGLTVFAKTRPDGFIKGLGKQIGGFPKGYIWVNDGHRSSMLDPISNLPNGWRKGRIDPAKIDHMRSMSKKRHTPHNDSLHSKSIKGRTSIFKDDVFFRVPADQLDSWIKDGWVIKPQPNKMTRPVRIDHVSYPSCAEACRKLDIAYETLRSRLTSTSTRWSGWQYD